MNMSPILGGVFFALSQDAHISPVNLYHSASPRAFFLELTGIPPLHQLEPRCVLLSIFVQGEVMEKIIVSRDIDQDGVWGAGEGNKYR